MTAIDLTRFATDPADTALLRAAKTGSLAGIRYAEEAFTAAVEPTFTPDIDDDEDMTGPELTAWITGFTNWSKVRWQELRDLAVLAGN